MTRLLDAARDYWERLFARDHPAAIAPLFAVGRWALVLARKLHEHRAFGRAAQMAYATLAAFVPLLLFAFGVVRAVAPGADLEILEQLVFQTFLGNIEPIRAVLVPGLEQVDLTTLGALSTAGLLVVAANLYLTAESAYSEVFEVEVDRPAEYAAAEHDVDQAFLAIAPRLGCLHDLPPGLAISPPPFPGDSRTA